MTESATILFLAANPATTTPLALDEEIRAIEGMIRGSEQRDAWRLISKWATRPDDLLQQLNEVRPTIVHFSGHGSASGGLMLHNAKGTAQVVAPAAVGRLFRVLRDRVRVVFLNACHSLAQAEAIAQEIDCVIGMEDEIGDDAARVFASSFYRALGFGRSVQEAFDQGLTALLLENIPEDQTPRLLTRAGTSAAEVYPLAPPAPAPVTAPPPVPANPTLSVPPLPPPSSSVPTPVPPPGYVAPVPGHVAPVPGGAPRIALLAALDDEDWIKKLRLHLKPLARKAGVEVWDSSMIEVGARSLEALNEGLARARVVVLLVTASLLADDEFAEGRLAELVGRAEADSIEILSLIASASPLAATELGVYKPLNDPRVPLDSLSPAEQNKRLLAIAGQIVGCATRTALGV